MPHQIMNRNLYGQCSKTIVPLYTSISLYYMPHLQLIRTGHKLHVLLTCKQQHIHSLHVTSRSFCRTSVIGRIPIVSLASRRRLVLLPRVHLIVINVWLNMVISVDSLWPHPLRVFCTVLLRVYSLVHPIATTIRLSTLLRGVTPSTIVTTVILTIRPTLTLSMPPTT